MSRFPIAVLAALLPWVGGAGLAQEPTHDPARLLATREGLEQLALELERTAQSPAYSEALRTHARDEAGRIRQRLRDGDFQVGDRILLVVEGEPQLSDTFIVAAGPVLTLPVIGELPLKGVLRSELRSHLARQLNRFIKDPVVHAQALIRISIFGVVAQPGFYVVPTEILLTDALMMAGGPAHNANLAGVWVERSGKRIWGGKPLEQGIIEGRTLDQMNLQAGDRIVVPAHGGVNVGEVARLVIFGVPGLIYAFTQIF